MRDNVKQHILNAFLVLELGKRSERVFLDRYAEGRVLWEDGTEEQGPTLSYEYQGPHPGGLQCQESLPTVAKNRMKEKAGKERTTCVLVYSH